MNVTDVTDERLHELRAACTSDDPNAKPFDLQGDEMKYIVDELLLRRGQKLYQGVTGDATDLGAKISLMIDESEVDDTMKMLALGQVIAAVIATSDDSWKAVLGGLRAHGAARASLPTGDDGPPGRGERSARSKAR